MCKDCKCPEGKEHIYCGCECHKQNEEINWYFVDAKDYFDNDNNGYIYGLEWQDKDGTIIYCEWFETERERDLAVSKL